jgi:hypothetical protein
MASDGSSDLQDTVTKAQTAALGFRVKSGWAAVVLLADTAHSPQLSDVRRLLKLRQPKWLTYNFG